MNKYFNSVTLITTPIISVFSYLMGGIDALLTALMILIVLDYITGLLKALYNKELSSTIGYKGIIKKICIFIIIAVSVLIETNFNINGIRNLTITFFAVNEALSLLENVGAMGIPLPKQLKEALSQLRGGNDDENNKKLSN